MFVWKVYSLCFHPYTKIKKLSSWVNCLKAESNPLNERSFKDFIMSTTFLRAFLPIMDVLCRPYFLLFQPWLLKQYIRTQHSKVLFVFVHWNIISPECHTEYWTSLSSNLSNFSETFFNLRQFSKKTTENLPLKWAKSDVFFSTRCLPIAIAPTEQESVFQPNCRNFAIECAWITMIPQNVRILGLLWKNRCSIERKGIWILSKFLNLANFR